MEFSRPQDSFKIWDFGPILGPIYSRKTKNIAKKQHLTKNYIFKTIKLHKSQVPDKSQNSYKNFQKSLFWGPKMYLLRYKMGPKSKIKRSETRLTPHFGNLLIQR